MKKRMSFKAFSLACVCVFLASCGNDATKTSVSTTAPENSVSVSENITKKSEVPTVSQGVSVSKDDNPTISSEKNTGRNNGTSRPSGIVTTTAKKTNTTKRTAPNTQGPVVPTKITMKDSEIMLGKGYAWKVKYTLSPANASSSHVKFKSSNTEIVTVSADGVITPAKSCQGGYAYVTATLPNGKSARIKVTVIYQAPEDNETLAQALSKKGISIPSHAAKAAFGGSYSDEVSGEYAVWANGSNGAKYSNNASIDMNYNSDMTITVTIWIKIKKAPSNGSITIKRDYYNNEKSDTINVKTGDLVQKTYTINVRDGGSNKVWHLTFIRGPLNLSERVFSISTSSASVSFS